MRTVILLSAALLLGACDKTFDSSEGKSRLVRAEHRAIISAKRTVIGSHGQPVLDGDGDPVTSLAVCAEPSPDALLSTIRELRVNAPEAVVKALLSYKKAENTTYIGLRTQTIQLLRDAYFRLCEAFLNDGIDAIAYDVLQRRFQNQIIALLAVEQLTGAVTAGPRVVIGYGPTQLVQITSALEDSEKTLHELGKEKNQAAKDLDALEKMTSGNEDEKPEIEAARRNLAMIEEQIGRREHVVGTLKKHFFQQNTTGTEPTKDTTRGRLPASEVAEAVRAITLNAINQDYESQVCFETLRYHNHLGQFRNVTNDAFDSGGLAGSFKEVHLR